MNISVQLAVVVAAVCLCLADGAPEGRLVRTKQQRPTRGFKNVEMMTARGFGKRDRPQARSEHSFEAPSRKKFRPKNSLMVAYDFGKRSSGEENFDEVLDADELMDILGSTAEKETLENGDDKANESIPVELFVMEMLNHPEFTRSIVSKFLDINQDGMLSLEELLRNTA